MSLLRFFRRGDQLTADRLNELVQAVEPTADLQNKPPKLNTKDGNIILIRNETTAALSASSLVNIDVLRGFDGLTVNQAYNRARNDGICLRARDGYTGRAAITLEPVKKLGYGKARYLGGTIFYVKLLNQSIQDIGDISQKNIIPAAGGTFQFTDGPGFKWITDYEIPHFDVTPNTIDIFFVVDGSWRPAIESQKTDQDYPNLLTSVDLVWRE